MILAGYMNPLTTLLILPPATYKAKRVDKFKKKERETKKIHNI